MTLKIETGPTPDREQLRALLIAAAEQLIGSGGSVLESRLSLYGQPVLLADAACRAVLLSFEPEDGEVALLNGLRAAAQFSNALPWIERLYPSLGASELAPQLVVVSRCLPPGASTILAGCPALRLFEYRVLRVNAEAALWLSCAQAPVIALEAETNRQDQEQPQGQTGPDLLPQLSEAESAYFR